MTQYQHATNAPFVATRPLSTNDVLDAQKRLVRYLHPHFRRRLTLDELDEAAAEALGELERAMLGDEQIVHVDRWLKRAAWHNSLDTIRRNEGEAKQPRPKLCPFDVDDHGFLLTDAGFEELELEDARAVDAAALARAFRRLKPDEQRALQLRYFDELPVEEVMGILGCDRHRYENLCKRGLHRLRDALVAHVADEACRATRSMIVLGDLGPIDDAAITTRDTHLESCVACRAFRARHRGLIAALPLPAAGFVERAVSRLQQLLPVAHQHGEVVGGSLALSGAGTAKTLAVVCSAGAVTAGVCAGVPAPDLQRPERRAAATAERRPPRARASQAPAATRPAVAVAHHAAPPATAQAPELPVRETTPSKPEREPKRVAPAEDASPFLPESAAPASAPSRASRHRAPSK